MNRPYAFGDDDTVDAIHGESLFDEPLPQRAGQGLCIFDGEHAQGEGGQSEISQVSRSPFSMAVQRRPRSSSQYLSNFLLAFEAFEKAFSFVTGGKASRRI